jgi:hypothetical protein
LNFAAGETPNDDQLLPPPSSVMTQPPAEDFLVANSSAVLQTPTVRSSSKTPVKFAFKPPPIAGYVDPRELMAAAKRQQERLDQPTIISRGLRVLGFSVRFALAAAVLYLLFYLQEWRTLQYCSSNNRAMANKDLFTVLGVPFPLPECRPCPPHAICQGSEIERCSSGYIVYHPIFPFHPKCEPDVVKYANIELLASTLAQYLSDHAGAVECGEIAGNTYQEESAVKQTMAARFPQWDRLRFNDYWQVLIDELASTPSLGKSGGVPTSIIQVRKK